VKILRLICAAVLGVLFIHGAMAHAVLLSADPPDGAILGTAPSSITLHFNEPVTPVAVRMLGPDGRPLALPGSAQAVDQDVRVALPRGLGRGGYLLSYRVISLDTHPVGGSLAFVVGAGSEPIPAAVGGIAAERWENAFPFVHGVMLLALSAALGGALFLSFVAVEGRNLVKRVRPHLLGSTIVAAVAAVLAVGVRGAGLAEASVAALLTWAPWRIGLSTAMGGSLGLILGGLVLGLFGSRFGSRPTGKLSSLIGVLLAAVGLGLTSHAALAPPIALAFPAYLLHATIAAFWFGSLPPLGILLAREPAAVAVRIVARFSAIAVWSVAILLIAGLILTLVQTGPDLGVWFGPVWRGGAYAPVLACKLVAVVCVLALALYHKRRLTPRLASGHDQAAASAFKSSIRREAAMMVVVLALAAALGSFEPPRSTEALAAVHNHESGGAALYVVRQGYGILLEMTPAAPGPNEITIRLSDARNDGARVKPLEVTIGLAMPSAGIEPLRRRAKPVEDGAWRVELMPVPVAGTWQVEIDALITDFDKLLTTIDIPIDAPAR
jgi:copper transport protein